MKIEKFINFKRNELRTVITKRPSGYSSYSHYTPTFKNHLCPENNGVVIRTEKKNLCLLLSLTFIIIRTRERSQIKTGNWLRERDRSRRFLLYVKMTEFVSLFERGKRARVSFVILPLSASIRRERYVFFSNDGSGFESKLCLSYFYFPKVFPEDIIISPLQKMKRFQIRINPSNEGRCSTRMK